MTRLDETRDYVLDGDHYPVRFQTAPGRFEGEMLLAQLFDAAAGYADATTYRGEDVLADYFRAPFNLDTLPEVTDLGIDITEGESELIAAAAGARLGRDGSGFVYLEFYSDAASFDHDLDGELAAEDDQ